MPSIGDLANDLARTLYEFRIPVAVLSVVAAVGILVVATRLGWVAAARRHPRRTGGAAAVALAVLVPAGWYLGSPIFIRTSLVEAAPSVAPAPVTAPTPTGPLPAAPAPTASAAPTPTPTPTPFVARAIATGEFSGTDDFHFGRGTASIIETSPGRFHLRLDDFSVRNGPDLYVYLSPAADDWTETALEVGTLKATDGSFGYDLPEGTDPSDFESVIIWCKQFSHLFAVAPFGA
ncbi:MAG: DM13 domain-containing protein [Candidatus Limnocylindrales bacterium]